MRGLKVKTELINKCISALTVRNKQNSAQNKTTFASISITTTANVSCYKMIPFPTSVISKIPKPQLFGVIKLSTVKDS